MKKPWGNKRKAELGFFDYLVAFFSEGFGWLILGLVAICGLAYFFGGKR